MDLPLIYYKKEKEGRKYSGVWSCKKSGLIPVKPLAVETQCFIGL